MGSASETLQISQTAPLAPLLGPLSPFLPHHLLWCHFHHLPSLRSTTPALLVAWPPLKLRGLPLGQVACQVSAVSWGIPMLH
jgi:hypothetical protein